MPEPLVYPPLPPWSPARHPLGDCRYCGRPAFTVDESHVVCHPGCQAPHAPPAVALAAPVLFEETGHG